MLYRILFFFVLFFSTVYANTIHDWDYGENGPDVWSERYPTCGGQLQSPINILTACTTYRNFTPFVFASSYNAEHNFTLKNNGHTIIGTFNNESELSTFTLTGGDLNGTFEFVNFHLHWGENHKSGSEHEVNGIKYAGEIHFVYMNHITNQTAVIGRFMKDLFFKNDTDKVSDENTRLEWQRYFNIAQTLKEEDNSTIFNLNLALLMGENLTDFWQYEGSLTTPPCTESVVWTIFTEAIIFVENEFKSFRDNIYFEDYRRPQPLYTRSIYRNFFNESLSLVPDYNCCPRKDLYQLPDHLTSGFGLIYGSKYSILLVTFSFFFIML